MSKAKIVLVSFVWLIILTIGVLLYRLWYVPTTAEKAAQEEQKIVDATSGNSKYKTRLKLGLDAFSGYAILRSDEMNQQLESQGIKVDMVDDGANYQQRLAGLASGELQMAAFPVDALLKASEGLGSLPATIVAIIDESRGADALVAYKQKFPSVDSLNSPNTKFVLVGDSPSETLVRVLMDDIQLDTVNSNSFVKVASEKELLARYRAATAQGNEVFVTWEPLVSELLGVNDELHSLVDSRSPSGYIVDALVVSREFLIEKEPVVREVLECYFRARYAFNDPQKLTDLILKDAAKATTKLTQAQAEKLAGSIQWKNTQENLAHFGLANENVVFIERIIDRIKRVLLATQGMATDPTQGDSTKLYYEHVLSELQAAGFHPGISPETVRGDALLAVLTAEQWDKLKPVGTLSVPPLVFARGTAVLTEQSQQQLDELVEKLQSWPQYYLMVRGNAGSRGDAEANRALAKQRADAALQYLMSKGVVEQRIRAIDGEITGNMSVTFILGQPAY